MTQKNGQFCYKVKSPFSNLYEFVKIEHDLLKKHYKEKATKIILQMLQEYKHSKNELVRFLIKKGEDLLIRKKLKEVLLILFELDSWSEDQLEGSKETIDKDKLLEKILNVPFNFTYESAYKHLILDSNKVNLN